MRKDFPQKLGLAIVAAAGTAFVVLAAWRQRFWIGAMILTAAVIVDAILYLIVPQITVCYRCRAEFAGPINPNHHGFDLATGEKYRGQHTQ
ncbi:hypothetical protein [Fontivita pretiosa]|uniref:hypothetical protein n=1 Tax=Fontivita pretiosa TaxID=2989684 RepID=UPI003D1659E6